MPSPKRKSAAERVQNGLTYAILSESEDSLSDGPSSPPSQRQRIADTATADHVATDVPKLGRPFKDVSATPPAPTTIEITSDSDSDFELLPALQNPIATNLPEDAHDLIKDSWDPVLEERSPEQVLARFTKGNTTIDIKRRDMIKLSVGEWLNDNIINFYMRMIQKQTSRAIIFSTQFFEKLERVRGDHEKIAGWTNKPGKNLNVFEKDFVFVPIHTPGHWCCGVIDMHGRKFEYYDSLSKEHNPKPRFFRYMRSWLAGEAHKKGVTGFEMSNLKKTWETERTNQPQQTNSVDCGVFVSQYVRYRCARHPLDFSEDDMTALRLKMTYEIRKEQLQPL